MAYIRDAQSLLSATFVCAPMNLGDVGTKLYSNLTIYRKLVEKGTFEMAFLPRKDIKDLMGYMKSQRRGAEEGENQERKRAHLNIYSHI